MPYAPRPLASLFEAFSKRWLAFPTGELRQAAEAKIKDEGGGILSLVTDDGQWTIRNEIRGDESVTGSLLGAGYSYNAMDDIAATRNSLTLEYAAYAFARANLAPEVLAKALAASIAASLHRTTAPPSEAWIRPGLKN